MLLYFLEAPFGTRSDKSLNCKNTTEGIKTAHFKALWRGMMDETRTTVKKINAATV